MEIYFVHQSFKWSNNAKAKAAVIVIILGIRNNSQNAKYIFHKTLKTSVKNISPYLIKGENVYGKIKFESGVHRVQRIPLTEAKGRVHTSAVSVAVLPEADEVEVDINEADIKMDVFRASGAGGQHVNRTESAVRLTHLPTGTVVACQAERSQHKNRETAMKMLKTRIYESAVRKHEDEIATRRKTLVSTGDRSAKIRTYNYPQGRITDHRINLSIYNLEAFMNGDIGEMLEQLSLAEQTEKLKEGGILA